MSVEQKINYRRQKIQLRDNVRKEDLISGEDWEKKKRAWREFQKRREGR